MVVIVVSIVGVCGVASVFCRHYCACRRVGGDAVRGGCGLATGYLACLAF